MVRGAVERCVGPASLLAAHYVLMKRTGTACRAGWGAAQGLWRQGLHCHSPPSTYTATRCPQPTTALVHAAAAESLWQMVREGLAMVDDGDTSGHRLYWVPCTGIEPAIQGYRQAHGLL